MRTNETQSLPNAWKYVSLDIMAPYPRLPSGNRFILVVEIMFTRWVEAFPLPSTSVKTISMVLEQEVFVRFGYPKAIVTDNEPQFFSQYYLNKCRI